MKDADCEDLECVKEDFKYKSDETIVCLPNRFLVVLKNTLEDEIDDIST